MAFARLHTHKRWLLGTEAIAISPAGEFAVASAVLGVGVVILTALLPGAQTVATIVALLAFASGATVAGRSLRRSYSHDRLGLCNVITLTRLALTMSLVAPFVAGAGASWAILAVAVVALALDGVDGWFARRQGNASNFGARFDMEVDSALALVLALSAAAYSEVGAAAILLGLPRYLFVGSMWMLPWMRRDIPERFSRKVVCVVQLGALIALQAPILPDGASLVIVPLAAGLIAWSFAVDVAWLWRHRT